MPRQNPSRSVGRTALFAALCAALAAAGCTKTSPTLGGAGDACLLNADCASGFVCSDGRCALPANLGGCEPGRLRCNGPDVEVCAAAGLNWDFKQTCATGCTAGACRPQACTPGQQRCSGDAAEACTPAGGAWALVQECATHCNPDTGRCRSPACAPFSARCDPSGAANVLVCDAYGSGYVLTACAPGEVCASGACQGSNANCRIGELRCNGVDVQKCVDGTPGTTRWASQGACLQACSGGACNPGGSCAGVRLRTAVQSVPLDGVSSALVFTDPILGLDGAPLPDGQLFSITATTASASSTPAILTPDVDPLRDGVQVRSQGGRVTFRVRAPPADAADAAGTLTAMLASGGSCGATAGLTFQGTATAAAGVLVAEDFRNPATRNVAATSADWNTDRGALLAGSPVDPGTGADGDLTVAANSSLSLSDQLMPAFSVISLSGVTVTLVGSASGLSGGDEVLLWDGQGLGGQSVNAGNFETARVLAVNGPTVTLSAPVRGTYGALGDQNASAQRVVLQRVPQLASLSVPAGTVLTGKAWDGATGGVLFLRVKGVAHISGAVSMDAKGYRGGSTAGAGEDLSGKPGSAGSAGSGAGGASCGGGYGTVGACATGGMLPGAQVGSGLLSKLLPGAGGGYGTGANAGGGSGGGVLVLAADTLKLNDDADDSPFLGRFSADGSSGNANGGGGAGGSIWLQARLLLGGSDPASPGAGVFARGGQFSAAGAGGSGRIRVDVLSTDRVGLGAGCARALPSCVFGVNGPVTAQSLDAYLAGGKVIRQATLVSALAAGASVPAGFDFFASAFGGDAPDFSPKLVIGTATDFVPAPVSPQIGNRFRWRIEARMPAGPPQQLLGLQWFLKVN